jgi:hypothetical protein
MNEFKSAGEGGVQIGPSQRRDNLATISQMKSDPSARWLDSRLMTPLFTQRSPTGKSMTPRTSAPATRNAMINHAVSSLGTDFVAASGAASSARGAVDSCTLYSGNVDRTQLDAERRRDGLDSGQLGKAGDVAARPRQAIDETRADRVGDNREHDRHRAGRLLQCLNVLRCGISNRPMSARGQQRRFRLV